MESVFLSMMDETAQQQTKKLQQVKVRVEAGAKLSKGVSADGYVRGWMKRTMVVVVVVVHACVHVPPLPFSMCWNKDALIGWLTSWLVHPGSRS